MTADRPPYSHCDCRCHAQTLSPVCGSCCPLPPGALAAARAAGPGSQDPVEAGLIAAAPLIRAAERERIRQMAVSLGATYEQRKPCSCGGSNCRGDLLDSHAPFADLLGEQP